MLNIFHTNWLTALRGNRQRTLAPSRKFRRGKQLEAAEVETLVQEICAHDPARAMNPLLPRQHRQRGREVRKTLNCGTNELDEVDALIREILDHENPLPPGLTAVPQPIPVGASVRSVLDGGRGYAKRALLN